MTGNLLRKWVPLVLIITLAHGTSPIAGRFCLATTLQETNALTPSRVGLVPVEYPDLGNLESDVREQLLAFQKQMAGLAGNSATRNAELSQAYGLMGQVYHAYLLFRPAEQCYFNAHLLAPREFPWIYLLGSLYQQTGRLSESILYFSEARRIRPDYLAAAVNLGTVYLDQNRLDEANRSFNEALAIDSANAAARYGLGQTALSRRDYAEAAKHFEKILEQVPQANRVHYSLAMAYRGLGDMEKTNFHLQRAGPVGVRPADPLTDSLKELVQGERMHLVRGRMAFNAGRFAEAAEAFRKAVAANPQSTASRTNLASALGQLGDYKAAISLYEELLKENPQNEAAHYNLGFILAKNKQHADAIPHLEASLRANPKNAETELLLAGTLAEAGRPEDAGIHIERVLEYDPENEDALLSSVDWLIRKGEYSQALERLRKAHELLPDRGRTAHMLAYMLAACPRPELRDGATALKLAQLVFASTKSVEHGATVALALAELGRCREAEDLQGRLIAQAEVSKNGDLIARLKADMALYKRTPCRPPGNQGSAPPRNQQ